VSLLELFLETDLKLSEIYTYFSKHAQQQQEKFDKSQAKGNSRKSI